MECLFEQFIMISYSYIRQECTFFYWYFYVQLVHGMPFFIKKVFLGAKMVDFLENKLSIGLRKTFKKIHFWCVLY